MKKIVTFGEVMLRLATPHRQRLSQAHQFNFSFGGGEANVAVSLSKFGLATQFVTRLPQNELTERCIMELRSYGVNTDKILFGGNKMGMYFIETGSGARASQVIYDREHSSIAEIDPNSINWFDILSDASWFHWTGITPALSPQTALACKQAIEVANQLNIPVSVDLNFRNKLWKYGKSAAEVMPELLTGCDMILGNEVDAESIFGIKPNNFDAHKGVLDSQSFKSICSQLLDRFPRAKTAIITLRGSLSADHNTWGGVLYDGKEFYTSNNYNITHIVDRVGGGDAFMAGIIYGTIQNWDQQEVLDFAAAASCLKHTIPGDFNLVGVDEVLKLMHGDASGRVNR